MLTNGFIKLHRSLLQWEWYRDGNTRGLYLHLLLTANYCPCKWRGLLIRRGQRVCSIQELAVELGMSIQQVRTAMAHLKMTGAVVCQATQSYTLVTVTDYDCYSGEAPVESTDDPTDDPTNDPTDRPQADQQQWKKKRKIKKKRREEGEPPPGQTFGAFGNVRLTPEQYEELIRRLGEGETGEYIDRLDSYMASSGKTYRDHYATILSWRLRDKPQEEPAVSPAEVLL